MMAVPEQGPDTTTDAAGPMVGLCEGQRCTALWLRTHGEATDVFDAPGSAAFRKAIGDTRGGVLIRLPCVGRCHDGPLIAAAHRTAGTTHATGTQWISSADDTRRIATLLAWIAASV